MPNIAALTALHGRWSGARANERANFHSYLIDLCAALGVERPGPAGSGYQFELPIKVITKDGVEVANFIDCYRTGFFAIEAKDEEPGRSTEMLLRKAFGQVRNYVTYAPGGLPPFIMVMDVAKSLIAWDRWTGNYGDWQAGKRIDLTALHTNPDAAQLLHTIWTEPASLDPRARAQAVTKEVAGFLANLARALESQGYDQERVARFIMRCVFTMFAEDVGLLKGEPFRQILERCANDPGAFAEQAGDLWKAMDAGHKFEYRKLPRFNGHFFRESEALPLSREAVTVLGLAAAADWQHVEPAIFGTLLTRALDPAERHRLGAEFTPREFVERVVRPTVEEPIRERWKAEQAVVLQLRESGKRKEAEKRLRAFHQWLRSLRFLDPACGSGNFLYVTMHIVKLVELEVLRELDEVTGKHELLLDEVHPKQFFGIEIKLWAREIAELVLWIGYHQFWRAHHDRAPKEPILEDIGNIECRDAVLAWDAIRHDPKRDRPDPTPRIKHPVTGKLVPDPKAKLKYMEYVKPRPAKWPKADFIVGNPPYLGTKRMREDLGDGYVDALRGSYAHVPDSADYVLYWWSTAARAVADGKTTRSGLITTNSIRMSQNRVVVAAAAQQGARIAWAIADHPWVDEADGAQVRVAMTVTAKAMTGATLVVVDDAGRVLRELRVPALGDDLSTTVGLAPATRVPLLANAGLSSFGFMLNGAGFILRHDEAERLLAEDARNRLIIRPYRNGRDLASRPRQAFVIDFATRTDQEARAFPVLYDIVRTRVKPDRAAKSDPSSRKYWWRFARNREDLREGLAGLRRFIATVETSRHRYFVFLDVRVAPDHKLIAFATDSAYCLGVLSARAHIEWALAAGGRLGVGNDPVYNSTLCFAPYPFPDTPTRMQNRIGELAAQLDGHRAEALNRSDKVTMTGMYNVVEKLRSGEALAAKEREIHAIAACGVLKDLHDELDALVAKAYGWEWPLEKDVILERLVALHDERVKEEKAGKVRWLRPDYQIPRFGKGLPARGLGLEEPAEKKAAAAKPAWPGDVISQIGAIKQLLAAEPLTAKAIATRFTGAKFDLVRKHLDILLVMGEVSENPDGKFEAAAAAVSV